MRPNRTLTALLSLVFSASCLASGAWLTIEKYRMRTRDIAVDLDHVYALRASGEVFWLSRYSNRDQDWVRLDDDRDNRDIEVSEGRLYILKQSGEVWRMDPGLYETAHLPPQPTWNPRLDRWTRVPGTENVVQMSATGDLLYTLDSKGEVKVHVHRSWWSVSHGLKVKSLRAWREVVWMVTEEGEVWRYLLRHPVRLERVYARRDAVTAAGSLDHPFVLTEDGRILHHERHTIGEHQGFRFREIARGAAGSQLEVLDDRVLYVLLPSGHIWRYEGERWWLELDDPRPRRILAHGNAVYTVAWDGTIWFRLPRLFKELANNFGTLDFSTYLYGQSD